MSCFNRGPAGESAWLLKKGPLPGGRGSASLKTILSRARQQAVFSFFLTLAILVGVAQAAESPQAALSQWIESIGGQVVRGPDGAIVEVSVARTWATDSD